MQLVDRQTLAGDPASLGRITAEGLRTEVDGRRLDPSVIALRAYPIGREPGFATLAEGQAVLAGGLAFPPDAPEAYVGDTVVDVFLHYLVRPELAA